MEILNTYTKSVATNIGNIMFIGGFMFAVIFVVIGWILCEEGVKHISIPITFFVLALMSFITAVVSAATPIGSKDVTHYEIVIDDDYSVYNLLDKYEIEEINGRIIDCIDKVE